MKRSQVDRTRDALLVVDVQYDFCSGGALEVPDGDAVVPVINSLITHFSHVFLTQDAHPTDHFSFASSHEGREPFDVIDAPYGKQTLWPDHCVQGTRGAAFHPLLLTHPARLIVRKGTSRDIDSYSAFFENDRHTPTGLGGALKEMGIRRLFLTGLATDFCVFYSAMDARKLGFDVTLIEDACRCIDHEGSLERALAEMHTGGVTTARSKHIL